MTRKTPSTSCLVRMAMMGLALVLAGCATTGHDHPGLVSHEWTGATFEYDVLVREWYDGERCKWREITLRALNKTHHRPVVSYVKATDRDCDETIDDWYFRDPRDRERVSASKLEDDVQNASFVVRRKE